MPRVSQSGGPEPRSGECRLSSHAQIGQRMAIPFGIEGSDSLVNSVGEVFAAGERLVCEMMPLQIAPYSLDGIELRGILLVAGFQADRIGLQGPGIADFGALA